MPVNRGRRGVQREVGRPAAEPDIPGAAAKLGQAPFVVLLVRLRGTYTKLVDTFWSAGGALQPDGGDGDRDRLGNERIGVSALDRFRLEDLSRGTFCP